jgi:hypothetical protein
MSVYNYKKQIYLIIIYLLQQISYSAYMKTVLTLVAALGSCVWLGYARNPIVTSLDLLDYDEELHLKKQSILQSPGCDGIFSLLLPVGSSLMFVAEMTEEVANSFPLHPPGTHCFAVRLVKGMAKSLVTNPISGDTWDNSKNINHEFGHGINIWVQQMLGVEIGWVSYWPHACTIYWVSEHGDRIQIANLLPGEKNTFWTRSFFAHEFDIVDAVSGELIGTYIAEYDSFHVVGDHSLPPLEYSDPTAQIKRELSNVYFEPSQVQRTFTELGFKKGRLPPDVWSSISAYYYNNKEHSTFEEQAGASVFINWWEAPCYFIGMPWGLKGRWQKSLLLLVQDWIGWDTPLEQSDIYGIRKYTEGARLLAHVDRITTHAVSLIINVAQGGVREPWKVEIYDFAGRLHEIEMNPGDVVYYEVQMCVFSLTLSYSTHRHTNYLFICLFSI